MLKCICGEKFQNYKELRVHIALATDRWPISRCCSSHHDPENPADLAALRWQHLVEETRNAAKSNRY